MMPRGWCQRVSRRKKPVCRHLWEGFLWSLALKPEWITSYTFGGVAPVCFWSKQVNSEQISRSWHNSLSSFPRLFPISKDSKPGTMSGCNWARPGQTRAPPSSVGPLHTHSLQFQYSLLPCQSRVLEAVLFLGLGAIRTIWIWMFTLSSGIMNKDNI